MNHLHFLTAPGAVSAAIAVFPAQALPAPPNTYVSAQSQIFDSSVFQPPCVILPDGTQFCPHPVQRG